MLQSDGAQHCSLRFHLFNDLDPLAFLLIR